MMLDSVSVFFVEVSFEGSLKPLGDIGLQLMFYRLIVLGSFLDKGVSRFLCEQMCYPLIDWKNRCQDKRHETFISASVSECQTFVLTSSGTFLIESIYLVYRVRTNDSKCVYVSGMRHCNNLPFRTFSLILLSHSWACYGRSAVNITAKMRTTAPKMYIVQIVKIAHPEKQTNL